MLDLDFTGSLQLKLQEAEKAFVFNGYYKTMDISLLRDVIEWCNENLEPADPQTPRFEFVYSTTFTRFRTPEYDDVVVITKLIHCEKWELLIEDSNNVINFFSHAFFQIDFSSYEDQVLFKLAWDNFARLDA